MSLKARITEDMKTAMKAKETAKLSAIRLLLAAVKQKEVCLLYTSPSPRDRTRSRMPSSA